MEIAFGALGVIVGAALVALGWAWQRERYQRLRAEQALTGTGAPDSPADPATLTARNRELALLNRVMTDSAAGVNLRTVMTTVCRELALLVDVPITAITLATSEPTTYEVVAEYLAGSRRSMVGKIAGMGDSPYVRFLQQHKQTMVIPDVFTVSWIDLSQESLAILKEYEVRSLVLVPLIEQDRIIGMLGVISPQPRVFTTAEIALAERVGAALCQALHITRLNAELRDSQARLRAAFDTAAVGLCVTDREDRYVQVNSCWARMIGKDATTLIGQPHGATIYSEDRTVYQAALARLMEGCEATRQLELRFCPANGQVFWGLLSLACIPDRHNGLGSVVQVIQDVSARREAETEREHLIRDLDAFAHSVAHNLRTPLAVVMGYTTMLMDDLKDVESPSGIKLNEVLQSMSISTHHMDEIISTMLFFARVRSTNDITLYPVNIAQTIMSALQRLDLMIHEYGAEIVQLDSNPAAEWPVAWGYHSWIVEVWANYITNALKYGGDRPRIELGWDTLPDGMLRFWVRDHGAGISAADQARLFKPFERLGASREGHGLGLSIVQRMVEKLDGQVGVESVEGQGSLFYFTLPPNPRVIHAATPPAP